MRAGFPELPPYVFQLVEAGAETGELGAALKDANTQMEAEDRLNQELRNALTYPIVLVCAGVAAVLFIFTAVVPRFAEEVHDLGGLVRLHGNLFGTGTP